MATPLGLSGRDGPLFKVDVLEQDQQEFRCLYLSDKLKNWVEKDLPSLKATWETEISCKEQVVELLELYCSGEPLNYEEQFHIVRPIREGVWELKTGDVRIFGWFHTKDHFIGVVADDAYRIKLHDLYFGYVGEVVRFRDALDLDEPKFIPGENPYAVLSNFD